jgi:hypothetical protein
MIQCHLLREGIRRILPRRRKGAKFRKEKMLPIAIGILSVPQRLSVSAVKIEIPTTIK